MIIKYLKHLFNTKSKPYRYDRVLHLWEDDYLMIELFPEENLNFISNETQRINRFGKKHKDGMGFTDVTVINEAPIKTETKKILSKDLVKIFNENNIPRIIEVVDQYNGYIKNDKLPVGFGIDQFGIMIENRNEYLKHIWFSGTIKNNDLRVKVKKSLITIGEEYNLIAVDWYKSIYFNLKSKEQIEKFLETSL